MEVVANRDRTARIFKFGVFELRPETGELWKHGIRVKLQTKPLQILEALLSAPGEVITREELFKRLWPDGTFVDFESGLNTATNRLRTALGDSADTPRYIETLPRLGYRFICPVTENLQPAPPALTVTIMESRAAVEPATVEPAPAPAQPNRMRRAYEAALALLLLVAVILVLFYVHSRVAAS